MQESHGSVKSYTIGFILSLILTIVSYFLATTYTPLPNGISLEIIIGLILALAFLQLLVQLTFFLHLNFEKGNYWNLVFLSSTVFIIFVVVLGSIWIMYHLNYNMMPHEVPTHIMEKENIHK